METNAADELEREEALARLPYLAPLQGAARAQVAAALHERRVAAGTYLFLEGEEEQGLFLVARGRVRIFKLSPEGREQGLRLAGVGESFNEIPALDGAPTAAGALALEETTLYVLARDDLLALLAAHPAVALALVDSLARRVRFLVGRVQALAFHSVPARLAQLLLEQAALNGEGAQVARSGWMTQQEMAAQLGTAREVVGRALRRFAADGLIAIERHQILILDPDGLRRLAAP